ncbi:MAG TPA: peptide deformylase [Anaerolineae bacterium]|nr:peptide deformylase [Anaerolineae bacterium]
MAVLDIVTVGDPRLRQRSRPVRQITPKILRLIDDMIDTMYEREGVGLAAVQVGELLRLIVIEVPEDEKIPDSGKLYMVINPEIVKISRQTEVGREGCLSVPGYVGEVERATEVVVRGVDVRGKPLRLRLKGYVARVFQHEIDHCEGVLYIDKLTAPDRIWEVRPGDEEKVEAQEAAEAAVAA